VKSARGVKLNKASDGDETDDSVTTEQSSLSKIIFLLIQVLVSFDLRSRYITTFTTRVCSQDSPSQLSMCNLAK